MPPPIIEYKINILHDQHFGFIKITHKVSLVNKVYIFERFMMPPPPFTLQMK